MPRAKKTARISTGGYYPARALFAPQAPRKEAVVISDDKEVPVLEEDPMLMEDITKEDEEEWVASPAPAPAPALALEPLLEEAV